MSLRADCARGSSELGCNDDRERGNLQSQLEIDLGFRVISVNAEVAWQRPDQGRGVGMGMRFAYASAAARSALRNFIALQIQEEAPVQARTRRDDRRPSLWA